MGRYLANGIVTKFYINKRKSTFAGEKFDLKKNYKKVLKDIKNIIDSSLYELVGEHKNYFTFALKPEVFNDNIHALIKEVSTIKVPNMWEEDALIKIFKEKGMKLSDEEFKALYPCSCKIDEKGNYFVEIKGSTREEQYLFPFYFAIKDGDLFDSVTITASVIMLWQDWDKYSGEDETNMLRIINNMKVTYYNNPLSKALIYYIAE